MQLGIINTNKVHYYLTGAIAFCIPIWPNILALLIALLLLNRILMGQFGQSVKNNKGLFFLFICLYLIYVIGLSYSENISFGLRDLETKLSLLLFPILFFTTTPFEKKQINKILWSFVIGCLVAFTICIVLGTYNVIDEQIDIRNGIHRDNFRYYYFFSSRLSPFIHPSYLAMYVVLGLIIIHQFSIEKITKNNTLTIAISIILITFILLLNSKAGILSLILFGIYFIGRKMIVEKKILAPLLIMISFTGVVTLLYFSVDEFAKKINQAIEASVKKEVETTADDSSSKRILVWKASRKIISDNYLIGVGTGDTKDELLAQYKKQGMNVEYEAGLNAHNQYYQTFIATGIIGFVMLFLSLFIPAYFSIKQKHLMYVGFILLFSINIFVESMLETQAGVIFYAFFNSIFAAQLTNKKVFKNYL